MQLPLVPLRDVVIFPGVVTSLFVGRDKSIKSLQTAMESDKSVMLVAQKNSSQENPKVKDLYEVGSVSTILQLIKLPDGTYKVLVEGIKRAKILSVAENNGNSHCSSTSRRRFTTKSSGAGCVRNSRKKEHATS